MVVPHVPQWEDTEWLEFDPKVGLHATAEEVDAWLASWGTDNELPAPVSRK